MKYRVVIDESGEAGIKKIRTDTSPGASPYLTLGAAFYPIDQEEKIIRTLDEAKKILGKDDLHCSKLDHFSKIRYIRTIKNCKFLSFGTISDKSTLGAYKNSIDEDSRKYYNKCSQYLLEQIGRMLKEHSTDPKEVEIVFEEGTFDYEKLRSLISRCQQNPIHENTKLLNFIVVKNITQRPKADLPTLTIADLLAHSLYKCVHKSSTNYQITEFRYIEELRSKFYADAETKFILGHGIKCIHDIRKLRIDDDIAEKLRKLKRD